MRDAWGRELWVVVWVGCSALFAPASSGAQVTGVPSTGAVKPQQQAAGTVGLAGQRRKVPWSEPRWEDYTTGAVALAGTGGLLWVNHQYNKPRWDQRLFIDPSLRRMVRFSTSTGRSWAGLISDMVLGSLVLGPNLVSAPLAYKKYGPKAAELLVINMQMISYVGFVTELSKILIGRARPYYRTCAGTRPDDDCGSVGVDESMISGHAAMSVASASLMCLHQEKAQLLTHRFGQAGCAMALGMAVSASMLRIASDRHYPSDVLVGAAVGVVLGYLVPKWRYYSGAAPGDGMIAPLGVPGGVGLMWMTPLL